MAILLIKTNGFPADEVDEIRERLDQHGIDYYETDAGRWGISLAGVWLRDDTHLDEASAVIAQHQQERYERLRGEYEERRAAGEGETVLTRLWQAPLAFLFYLFALLAILYLTLAPYFGLIK